MSLHAAQNMTCPPSAGGLETNLLSFAIPFYFVARKDLVAGIPDAVLSLVAHHIVYWALSVVFDILDHSGWKWLDRYRVHDPDGSKPRNLATRSQVVFSVVAQQVMQTGLGLTFLEEVPHISLFRCEKELEAVEGALLGFAQLRFIPNLLVSMLALHKSEIAYWLYWWIIPISQLILAMIIFDTWMYFGHRLMHVNKFLYKHVHSIHHRLYAPYAFGALYGHVGEGFIQDVMGSLVASSVTGLTPRQNLVFFTFSVVRVIDQHSGYRFPYNPLGWWSKNDAEYHAIHHQASGMKYNFSQPLFIHWDVLMGTRMTRKDLEERRRKKQ